MNIEQLASELEFMLEDAAEMPALADVGALWQQAEQSIRQLPVRDQLQLGGIIIAHLADIHHLKAEHFLDAWENAFNPQDPALPGDWLQGLVRQTQHVDVSELTMPVQRRPRSTGPKTTLTSGSVVAEVPKANLLNLLEQVDLAAEKANALSVAHEENVENSAQALNAWFISHPGPIQLSQLRQELGWPFVQLWLCLLLGGFHLQATDGQFYSGNILVSSRSSSQT